MPAQNDGWTPLHVCAEKGHLEILTSLIKAGADVHAQKDDSMTALHVCVIKGHMEVARALIEARI